MLFLHEVGIYIKKYLPNFELGIDMVKGSIPQSIYCWQSFTKMKLAKISTISRNILVDLESEDSLLTDKRNNS